MSDRGGDSDYDGASDVAEDIDDNVVIYFFIL